MDPFTVVQIAGFAASAAKGAVEVCQDLYVLYSQAQHVDQTVQGLVTEVQALGDACTLVDERLRDIVDGQDGVLPGKARLWRCVELQVRDSRKTIDQLQLAFQDIRGQSTGVLDRVWRQIRLNTRTKDIGEARNRIRSHTASLQMVLQTVAIEVCYSAPRQTEEQLQTLLLKAEECVDRLKALQAVSTEEDAEQKAREAEIIAVGEATLSTAHQSLYDASIANRSVLGDPTFRSSHVRDWMRDVSAIERTTTGLLTITENDVHSTISDEPSTVFTEDLRRQSTAPTSIVANEHHKGMPEMDYSPSEDEDDAEHELLIDAAKDALDTGRTAFYATEYKDASDELQEALKIILELPSRQQSRVCDTWEIRYLLSVCAYHTDSLSDAKSQLWSVVDYAARLSSPTDKQLQQWCEAGHLLGIVCVKMGNLEEARQYCESAYNARTKLHGKTSAESFRSLALLARILHLQGRAGRSRVYGRLIPENDRARYLKEFEDLAVVQLGTDAKQSDTSLVPLGVTGASERSNSASAERELDREPSPLSPHSATTNLFSKDSIIPSPTERNRESETRESERTAIRPTQPSPIVHPTHNAVELRRPTVNTASESTQIVHANRAADPAHEPGEQVKMVVPTWRTELTDRLDSNFDLQPKANSSLSATLAKPNERRSQSTESTQLRASRPQVTPEMRSISSGSTVIPDESSSRTLRPVVPQISHQRTFSTEGDNRSIISTRSTQDPKLSNYLNSLSSGERREVIELLPQINEVDRKILHICLRIRTLENQHQRSVPRECIVETHTAEKAVAKARNYIMSSFRPMTRPEVQKAQKSTEIVERILARYEISPEKEITGVEDEVTTSAPAVAKKPKFFRSSSKSEKIPQDILIETSRGDVRVRVLDDSKACKQFAARAQEGSFTDQELQCIPKGLKALDGLRRGGQAFLITPPPTRITDEKDTLIGYVTDGFELVRQALEGEYTTALKILDCRLAPKARAS